MGGAVGRKASTLYQRLLRDPRWQRVRLQVFERDGWACTRCHATGKQLQVHHTRYLSPIPWETPLAFLLTLCEECHGPAPVRSLCGDSDFWPVIKMGDGTYLKGPRAELVGRWQ
jgi:5-methylcytosine-specific restriction endonuclease McrA